MKRKWLLIAVVILVVIPAACMSACLLTVALAPTAGSERYPDFRRFASADDLKSYLISELPLGSRKTSVEQFMTSLGVSNCFQSDSTTTNRLADNEMEIKCTVLAPSDFAEREDWFSTKIRTLITLYLYDIDLTFEDRMLREITVDYGSISW